jgi:hypothetical protein
VKCSIKRFFKVAVLLLLILMVIGLGLHGSFGVLADDDVSSSISAAEDALQRAFVAVLDAENAGANVSALLLKLDVAGENLTDAEMAYKSGSLIEAVSKAEECSALANGIIDEASALKNSALTDARRAEWQTFTFSGIGAFVISIVLALVWIIFKRSYNGKLLGMKPGVGSDIEA